jgi:hypothetical protein
LALGYLYASKKSAGQKEREKKSAGKKHADKNLAVEKITRLLIHQTYGYLIY